MAVLKRLRFEILRRDNHTCRYCGGSAPDVILTVDHVIPVSLGGSDDPSNLVAACKDCNAGKTSSNPDAPLVDTVADDALRWAAAMKQAAAELASADDAIEDILDAVANAWKPYYMPADWAGSVVTFIKAGLSQDDLLAMVDVAYRKRGIDRDRWSYFCGCCWSRVRQMQDRATEILKSSTEVPVQSGAPTFSTSWNHEEIQEFLDSAQQAAARWLKQDSIDSSHCRHREWGEGDCGDPVCQVVRGEALNWMVYMEMTAWDKQCAVMDAAEVALDG